MAYYVSASLVKMGLAGRNESNRFVLTDPSRLIRQWAASSNYLYMNKFSDYHTFETEFEKFLSRLSKLGSRGPAQVADNYALTLHSGAWLVAPYVRPTDFHIYIHPQIAKQVVVAVVKILELSPVERGGNVRLVAPYDEGVFYGASLVDGVRVASPVQLYVDLFNYAGRGEEAAAKLLEKLARAWQREELVRH